MQFAERTTLQESLKVAPMCGCWSLANNRTDSLTLEPRWQREEKRRPDLVVRQANLCTCSMHTPRPRILYKEDSQKEIYLSDLIEFWWLFPKEEPIRKRLQKPEPPFSTCNLVRLILWAPEDDDDLSILLSASSAGSRIWTCVSSLLFASWSWSQQRCNSVSREWTNHQISKGRTHRYTSSCPYTCAKSLIVVWKGGFYPILLYQVFVRFSTNSNLKNIHIHTRRLLSRMDVIATKYHISWKALST